MADQRIMLSLGGHTFVLAKRHSYDWQQCLRDRAVIDGKEYDLGDLLNAFICDDRPIALCIYYEHEPDAEADPQLAAINAEGLDDFLTNKLKP